jgi:hypothetical protein
MELELFDISTPALLVEKAPCYLVRAADVSEVSVPKVAV